MADQPTSQPQQTGAPGSSPHSSPPAVPQISAELQAVMSEPAARQTVVESHPKHPISELLSQPNNATIDAHKSAKQTVPAQPAPEPVAAQQFLQTQVATAPKQAVMPPQQAPAAMQQVPQPSVSNAPSPASMQVQPPASTQSTKPSPQPVKPTQPPAPQQSTVTTQPVVQSLQQPTPQPAATPIMPVPASVQPQVPTVQLQKTPQQPAQAPAQPIAVPAPAKPALPPVAVQQAPIAQVSAPPPAPVQVVASKQEVVQQPHVQIESRAPMTISAPEPASIPTLIESEQPTTEHLPTRLPFRIPRFVFGLIFLFIGIGSALYVAYTIISSLPPHYKDLATLTYQQAVVPTVKDWTKTEALGVVTLSDATVDNDTGKKKEANAFQFVTYVPNVLGAADLTADRRQALINDLINKKDEFIQNGSFKQNCTKAPDITYAYQAPAEDQEFIRVEYSYACLQPKKEEPANVKGQLVISKKGELISTAVMANNDVWNANDKTFKSIIQSLAFVKK